MTDIDTPPARRRRPGPTLIVVAVLVVVAATVALVAWPLGGWQTVALTRDHVAEVAVDEPFDAQPFVMSVHDATVSTVAPNGYGEPSDEGDVFLTVEATLRSDWTLPLNVYTFDETLVRFDRLGDLDGYDAIPSIRRADDLSGSVQAGPGVEVPVLFTWEVPADWFAEGDDLIVTVSAHRSRSSSLDAASTVWDDFGAVAAITCSIREIPAPEEES